jgi:hypothetical protein
VWGRAISPGAAGFGGIQAGAPQVRNFAPGPKSRLERRLGQAGRLSH